ncbi:MAG: hypothetical protein ACTSRK_20075 [Promethearchaeota archaeon]
MSGPESNNVNNRHSLNIPGEQENFVTPRLGRRESVCHPSIRATGKRTAFGSYFVFIRCYSF